MASKTTRSYKTFGVCELLAELHPFHAAKLQPMQKFLEKNQHFYWNEKIQEAFDSVEQALAEATALAAPTMEDVLFWIRMPVQ